MLTCLTRTHTDCVPVRGCEFGGLADHFVAVEIVAIADLDGDGKLDGWSRWIQKSFRQH